MAFKNTDKNILLTNGLTKTISDLKIGDKVDTLDQYDFKRGEHKVVLITKETSKLLSVDLDGKQLECTPNHKFYVRSTKKWVKAKDLKKGNKVTSLEGELEFIKRKKIEEGEITHLTVEGAHTYIYDSVLCHNKGNTTVQAPPPPPPDNTFKQYLEEERRKERRDSYQDWVNDIQTYKTAKQKQASGREGWADFKTNVKGQLSRGIITYDQATKKLTDYSKDNSLGYGSIMGPGQDPRKAWDKKHQPKKFGTIPKYETSKDWKKFNVQNAISNLSTYYHGDGEALGVKGDKYKKNIDFVYQDLLGRDATDAEKAKAEKGYKSGYWKDLGSLSESITKGDEYRKKFNKSYLDNYYDTMFGKSKTVTRKDKEGKEYEADVRTFQMDTSSLPKISQELLKKTGLDLGPDSPFTTKNATIQGVKPATSTNPDATDEVFKEVRQNLVIGKNKAERQAWKKLDADAKIKQLQSQYGIGSTTDYFEGYTDDHWKPGGSAWSDLDTDARADYNTKVERVRREAGKDPLLTKSIKGRTYKAYTKDQVNRLKHLADSGQTEDEYITGSKNTQRDRYFAKDHTWEGVKTGVSKKDINEWKGVKDYSFDPQKYLKQVKVDKPKEDKTPTPTTGGTKKDESNFVGTTGTVSEIEEYLQNIRDTKKFIYTAGLTQLQGDIDKEVTKIKNKGARDVAEIGGFYDMAQGLTSGFWS